MERAYSKNVIPRKFQVVDLVLSMTLHIQRRLPAEKFTPHWEGPYTVTQTFNNGTYVLVDEKNSEFGPVNGKWLKRYYA
ncbi:hypothetical protein BVC80_1625g22 [Macleaya cordata]|uniref:Uncharacterized protein n=1 Tax=Macleaya cordata TaxID=56857 RepID=A0A200Q1D1_MACCD|nr:hypothetical protein BVC80_1625g22 [Macleaya cordata]